ncbi:MAG TPA: hypothetical protein VGL26_09580 [Jatrophihabitans sp.]
MDELLDERFALGRGAMVEDVVDVVGEGVQFVIRGHGRGLVEQFREFVTPGLELGRLGLQHNEPRL